MRGAHRGARSWLDYTDDREGELVGERLECVRRGGVAGDDDRLHPLMLEPRRDLARVAANSVRTLGAVGDTRGVAEIDDPLVRQLPDELPHHCKATDPGIEDADGRVRPGRSDHHRTVAVRRVRSPSRCTETRAGTSQ